MSAEVDDGSFCTRLRKGIELKDMEGLVNREYNKITELKQKAEQRERELEAARRLAEHNRKIKKIVQDRVDFPKAKAFKRQNSFVAHLEDFYDIDD